MSISEKLAAVREAEARNAARVREFVEGEAIRDEEGEPEPKEGKVYRMLTDIAVEMIRRRANSKSVQAVVNLRRHFG